MQIYNHTDLSVAAVPSLASSDGPQLIIVAKGTFRLQPDSAAVLAEEQRPPTGDTFENDDPERPLRYPADFAPYKPHADLLLVGTAHAPGGSPVERLPVSFAVGPHRRTLVVTGDRERTGWVPGLRRPSDPAPFRSMPLGYDRSYGGSSIPENPHGIGAEDVEDAAGRRYRPLPNIEDPAESSSRPDPAGFGPLPAAWPQRADKAGRFRRDYKDRHWPALPPDFDWSYFNAAPPPMQVAHLRGDESVELGNLHPDHPLYRSRLPALRARCFVEDARDDGEPVAREAALRLDTVWIDADAEDLVLVWRAGAAIRSKEADDVEAVWFVTEPLEEEPLPLSEWMQRLRAERDAAAAPAAPEAEPDSGDDAAVEAAFQEQIGKLRDQLVAAGVPTSLVSNLETTDDPEEAIRAFCEHFGIDPAEGERIQSQTNARLAQMLKDSGEDPGLLDEAMVGRSGTADPAALRGLVESRHAAGRSVADEDLSGIDLSGAQLPDIDLRGAVLTGARLDGADLEGADLTGATLSGASLRGARLQNAKLGHADLSGADFTEADLGGAFLEWAVADGAQFVEARLPGIEGACWRAARADFSRADLSSARLDGANFESSILDATILAGARMVEASLQGARGEATDLRGADLTKIRASDGAHLTGGLFTGTVGPDSIWANADLTSADFGRAELPGADFSECLLHGASFAAANLRGANLSKSRLDRAICSDANFFEGNFYAAQVGRADFSRSNLFSAEMDDAVFGQAILDGADIRRTRLAG